MSNRGAVTDVIDWLLSDQEIADALGYDGTGNKPFWFAQEQPESTPPYIIYNTRLTNAPSDWWMETGNLIMALHVESVVDGMELFNMIRKKCNRGDESARPLNQWLRSQGRNDFLFHSLAFTIGGDAGVSGEEGGINPIFISLEYKYSPAVV